MIACTRPSTLAKTMDTGTGLQVFLACAALQQIASMKDLRDQLAMTTAESWRDFKPLYEEAHRRRGKPEAQAGTNIHVATQMLANGWDASTVPYEVLQDARAVMRAMEALDLEPVAAEQRVVNLDGLPEPYAGTLDLLVAAKDGQRHVVDIKTVQALGNSQYRAASWAVQLACYANGRPWLGEPIEWPRDQWGRPKIDPIDVGEPREEISLTEALVVEVERDTGRTECHLVDIVEGWRLARLACEIRAARKAPLIETIQSLTAGQAVSAQ